MHDHTGNNNGPYDSPYNAIVQAYIEADEEPEETEALQHWVVSSWLADELEAVGALVARDILGFDIWGRTQCGQGLEEDGDLNRVAEKMISH